MKKYASVFRIRFINALQYRAAALAGIFTNFLWGLLTIIAFRAFYRANPSVFPMEFPHMVSYIWIQQAFLSLFVLWSWDNDIASTIQDGRIAYEMVRPMDIYSRWFSQISANRLAGATLRCLPILTAAFIIPEPYKLTLPPSAAQALLFFLSAGLGLCVTVALTMLMYISLFYTLSPLGVRAIMSSLADFLAGQIIPLPFFPARIRKVVELLPFASMQNMPLRIYTGNIMGADAYRGIAIQLIWLVALILLGKHAMKRALGKVIVQGG